MLDQLINIVKQFGQDTVVKNPEVPNEHNEAVMADATKTIASGFQNVMAGGGFQNILDLFKGQAGGTGKRGLLSNPIVTMMIGYFISKLVGKYKMNPASASQVANNLIPDSISDLIRRTNDPGDDKVTLDNLVGALAGKGAAETQSTATGEGFSFQHLLNQFTGGQSGGGGFDLQDIIGSLTQKTQHQLQDQQSGGGGLMDLIKGFMK